MRAVISVVGKDGIGILSKVSSVCSSHCANVVEVSQTILQDMFVMIMLVDTEKLNTSLNEFQDAFNKLGEEAGLVIHVMHEDIFNSMHQI